MAVKNKKRKDRGKDRKFSNSKQNKRMSFYTKASVVSLISISVILIAYLYNKYKLETNSLHLEETLANLIQIENSVSVTPGVKVALGFGSCQDVIVQSSEVIFDRPPLHPEHFSSIKNKEEFLKVFAYFFRHGAAAERFISNSTFFSELVELANEARSAQYFVGGNAPLMAKRFAKEGVQVFLGAQMSKKLQKQFPSNVQFSGPTVETDDKHLLLEYPAGKEWGHLIPSRANRFIVHNDYQNPQLSSLDTFITEVEKFNPNLLVIGGLQMMDNFPMKENHQRNLLKKVQGLMIKQSDNVRIHFEMASFSDERLLRNIVDEIIPYADSLGMNEQELPNLYQMIKYGNLSLISESRPRTATILDQMRKVFKFLQNENMMANRRKLTRLHLHTLAFQAFIIDKDSQWKNTKAAAAKSALVANRHTCGSDNIDIKKAKLLMDDAFTSSVEDDAHRIPFNSKDPVSCWDEEQFQICIAPVLVCSEVQQTGGGGDNVSSAGLVLQI